MPQFKHGNAKIHSSRVSRPKTLSLLLFNSISFFSSCCFTTCKQLGLINFVIDASRPKRRSLLLVLLSNFVNCSKRLVPSCFGNYLGFLCPRRPKVDPIFNQVSESIPGRILLSLDVVLVHNIVWMRANYR